MAKKLLENLFLMDRGKPFTGQTMWVLNLTNFLGFSGPAPPLVIRQVWEN